MDEKDVSGLPAAGHQLSAVLARPVGLAQQSHDQLSSVMARPFGVANQSQDLLQATLSQPLAVVTKMAERIGRLESG